MEAQIRTGMSTTTYYVQAMVWYVWYCMIRYRTIRYIHTIYYVRYDIVGMVWYRTIHTIRASTQVAASTRDNNYVCT